MEDNQSIITQPVLIEARHVEGMIQDFGAYADALDELGNSLDWIKAADLRYWAQRLKEALERSDDDAGYCPVEGKSLFMVSEEIRGFRSAIFEADDEDDAERRAGINFVGEVYDVEILEKVEGGDVHVERYDPGTERPVIKAVDASLPAGISAVRGAVRVNKIEERGDE